MSPGTSVIIPSYNSAAYLPDAIDSALNQTIVPLEVIVVNDGSTDETPRILERYQGRIVAITQENRGLSGARNRGIAAARGELVAFLDADDVWLPEKLEKQIECLNEHPRAGLVHSAALLWNHETGVQGVRFNGNPGQLAGACYEEFFTLNRVTVSTMVVRRECLAKVGIFDEDIRRPTTQDWDLCFRIARYHELAYIDKPLILYRVHESNATKRDLDMQEDILYVLQKALRTDANLRRKLGRALVNNRLFELALGIAYLHHAAGRSADARRYSVQTLRHRPSCRLAWSICVRNSLPPAVVRTLRGLKRAIIPRSQ
jgi:glycosyltransferase involved in cell wall biosynthesis